MTHINGHHHVDPMALFHLGELKAEARRQTEIILSQGERSERLHRDIISSIDQLPERIASRMPPQRQPILTGQTMVAILQALLPLGIIALIIAAKSSGALGEISLGELLPLIRQ